MRNPFNKFIQMLALFASVGATSKQQFKENMIAKKDVRSHSLSSFAEGINPNTLSFKRVKGKWRVKR
jgi:hypothetical protein